MVFVCVCVCERVRVGLLARFRAGDFVVNGGGDLSPSVL